jgi:uroporphyrinogen decarboxylase
MNSRERLRKAINHQEPDRVPLDLGGIVSGITRIAYRNLKNELNFPVPSNEYVIDRIQQLVKPDEQILDWFQIDTRYAYQEVPPEIWSKDSPDSIWVDEWGIKRRFTGLYFDMIGHPLSRVESLLDLEKLSWPDPHQDQASYNLLQSQVEKLHQSEKAVIVNIIGSCFEFGWYLRGFEKIMMDLVLNPNLACAILDIMLEFQIGQFEELLSRTGNLIDVILCGDDLATQNSPFVSLDLYRRYIKPRQKKLYDFIKTKTNAPIFYHSCGAVSSFIPELIEIGVQILNPVQVKAQGMDLHKLKKEFGKQIVFWGGIDTQYVLPFGKPSEVRDEVRRRIDELAPGGGYILAAVHNIQADVPPQNIIAMFEEAIHYGRY